MYPTLWPSSGPGGSLWSIRARHRAVVGDTGGDRAAAGPGRTGSVKSTQRKRGRPAKDAPERAGSRETPTGAARRLSVLVISGDRRFRTRFKTGLGRHFGLVECTADAAGAGEVCARCHFDYVLADEIPGQTSSVELINGLDTGGAPPRVLILTERDKVETALDGLHAGARDLLLKPVSVEDAVSAIKRLDAESPATASVVAGRPDRAAPGDGPMLVGKTEAIARLKQMIRKVAPFPATVLIQGETGTGKELVARLLHQHSGRKGSFIPVNCGAIAPELMESELFGHTRGAFTSAHKLREGLFLAARGGTLFLDEISEMPIGLQVKLLRALEEGKVRPVGSDREVPLDVRVAASTQHDLQAEVKRGRFREDLLHRINVVHLRIPALRQRREDIPMLASHFMVQIAAELAMKEVPLDPASIQLLQAQEWSGNVRQLRNVIERTVLLGELPTEFVAADALPVPDHVAAYPLDWTLEEVKTHHMKRVLAASGGNKSEAARRLDVSRKTLERKLGSAVDGGDTG